MLSDALEILWPTQCAGCDVPGRGRLCGGCAEALAVVRIGAEIAGVEGALAAARYDSPLGIALKRAKYGRDPSLLAHLADRFARTLAPFVVGGRFDAIVPIPSPWTRRVVRGFSTGAVLARHLSRASRIPVRSALSLRPGPRNAGLDAIARRSNLRGRLRARRPVAGRVLLIDDVVTTGSTAAEAAGALHGGGTRSIWLATLCVSETRGDVCDRRNPPAARTKE